MLRFSRLLALGASIALPLVSGFIGNIFTSERLNNWYAALDKPWFNPPNWLFGPVWTVLYILVGLSFYLIFITQTTLKKYRADLAYTLQLVINTFWTIAFFALESPVAGIIVILSLLAAIGWTMYEFHRIRPMAAYVLVPYLLWVSFAAVLNIAIASLN
jgi:tryptophan-rich sensory protein